VKDVFVKDVACGIGQLSHDEAELFLQNLENTGYFRVKHGLNVTDVRNIRNVLLH
jgi:hypothetical protein